MICYRYKLRHVKAGRYLLGYASEVKVEDGMIHLTDRRLPEVRFKNGEPTISARRLGDHELDGSADSGWAVWAVAIPLPAWWGARPPADDATGELHGQHEAQQS